MIGLRVRNGWDEASKIFVSESLEGLVDGLTVYLSEFFMRPLETPLHDRGDDHPFPVRGIKLRNGFIPSPEHL